jgi:MarR family transcriptional repressor of emrRAB
MNKARAVNLLGAFVDSVYRQVESGIDAKLGMGGETPAAIVMIGTNPGRSMDFLARALVLSHSGTVRLVDRLEKEEYVRRESGKDKRAVALRLTTRGQRKMQEILGARRACLEAVFEVLTRAEQRQLTESVETMLASMSTSDQVAECMCRLCEEAACPQPTCPVTQALNA